nr:hypothetical protein [Tanacetum cinerariifolium]
MGNRVNEGLDSNRVHVRSVSVNEHGNVGLESSILKNLVVNAGVESFPTVSEAHGFHLHACANEVNMNDASTMVGHNPASNTLGMFSYANVTGVPSRKALNLHTLFTPAGNGVDVVIPAESIGAISNRFANTAYGFFLGNRVAYHVVANYWNPDVNLMKEDVGNVPIWVILHGVSVTAFNEDGLSVIANKLGTPLMLDSIHMTCASNHEQTIDCTERVGISSLMKSTSAIRQMAYKSVPDSLDEYLQMGATTTRKSPQLSCKAIMELYGRYEALIVQIGRERIAQLH